MTKNNKIMLIPIVILMLAIIGVTVTGKLTKKVNSSTLQSQEAAVAAAQAEVTDSDNEEKATEPTIIKYIVKPGDTLESIAKTYNVKISTISESNRLTNKNYLKEGQELEFPSIVGVLYQIKNGDNLWDIASTYDIDVDDIVGANNLESSDNIKIGQTIILPHVDKIKTQPVYVAKITEKNFATTKNTAASKNALKSTPLSASLGFIWPTRGRISSKFGPRWGRQHTGLDIAAPIGTSVYASMGGKVVFSGWKGSYGNLIIIDHGNGLETYYGHNSKLLVKSGQSVSKGTLIAKVGSTGNSTGPHSHFEVRKNGVSINPLNYLK